MSDEELRELFTPAKRKAVALFKDNHDNGDTAIYQFITDIIPLLQDRDAKRDVYVIGPDDEHIRNYTIKRVMNIRNALKTQQRQRAKEWGAALKEVKK